MTAEGSATAEVAGADRGVLGTSVLWAAGVAVGAAVLGWMPGRRISAWLRARRMTPIAALLITLSLAPICLPAYAVFACWWQAVPPDSAIQAWAIHHGLASLLRRVILAVGLLCWAWPIAAWCVGMLRTARSDATDEIAAVDGAPLLKRVQLRLREDGPALLVAAAVVFAFILSNTTCFDLAQVRTFGYEVRTIDAQGGSAGQTLAAAWPAMLIVGVIATGVWLWASRRREASAAAPARGGGGMSGFAILLVVSVLIPAGTMMAGLLTIRTSEFFILYSSAITNTLIAATAVGGTVGVLAASLTAAALTGNEGVRRVAGVIAVMFLAVGTVPGTVIAVAIESAYNRPMLADAVYESPLGVVLGLTALCGLGAVVLAYAAARGEPRSLRSVRAVDGADRGRAFFAAVRPSILAAGAAAAALGASLSMSEVTVTARLQRPGFDLIAASVLNAIHYQHPETVVLSLAMMFVVAVAAAIAAVALFRRRARLATAAACLGVIFVAGCGGDPGELRELPMERTFGSVGNSPGQFDYPRAIAADERSGRVFVIDKTARVQRFSPEGVCEKVWRMPEWEMGKPTGLSIAPDGRVVVADTHYHRVIIFDADGHELRRFGEYGLGAGQFVYPTDIAFGPEGNLYVAEYGGNDRIQVFTPEGEWVRTIGAPGSEPGQFSRPQAIAMSAQGDLIVADACNHRVQVLSRDGAVKSVLGRPGQGAGELSYPYGIVELADGSLLIAEFGNNRVQRLEADGRGGGMWGGIGFAAGKLRYPWGVARVDDTIFVLDSGNSRVQVVSDLE